MKLSLGAIDLQRLRQDYRRVRAATVALCGPLEPEDMVVQTMPEVSPTKWHLAHVTWFFETMVLARFLPGYEAFDRRYHALFNSYYQSLGQPFPRDRRGLLTRPTVAQVMAYRRHVDAAMAAVFDGEPDDGELRDLAEVVTIGVHHEQQHQELMLMDILNVLAHNPLRPAYRSQPPAPSTSDEPPPAPVSAWRRFGGGEVEIGAHGEGFRYDNEFPRHRARLEPFEIGSRLVTNGEYRAFMADGGYRRPELWLADGWDLVRREGIEAPLYWQRDGGGDGRGDEWRHMTLRGLHAIDPAAPVCHVSYYEAAAYASWQGCRLPTEREWEHAAQEGELDQVFDHVWQWTSSPYVEYPGYRPFAGALGEYNGKFMINQLVLRGGCHATPLSHVRLTYRNFYYPHQRWQFGGLRLARGVQR